MQRIYLDISNKGVIPTIYAKQGDIGRKFEVVLTDSGLPYVPIGGSAFSVWYSGASGEGNYTDIDDKSAFSVNGNKVVVEMIAQMLSNDGEGILALVLSDPNGNQVSTWNIPYVCEFVPGSDSEEARSYYTAFSNAVQNLPYPDSSLSIPGKSADAKAVGDALNNRLLLAGGAMEGSINMSGHIVWNLATPTGWGDAANKGYVDDGLNNKVNKFTLLWQNASPNSLFAAQTISVDLSAYDTVMITYNQYYENHNVARSFIPKFCFGQLETVMTGGRYRTLLVSNDGVSFNDQLLADGSAGSNNFCIPAQIFGCKLS